jgi:hypothetical protein
MDDRRTNRDALDLRRGQPEALGRPVLLGDQLGPGGGGGCRERQGQRARQQRDKDQ